jgi:hypothetical protein
LLEEIKTKNCNFNNLNLSELWFFINYSHEKLFGKPIVRKINWNISLKTIGIRYLATERTLFTALRENFQAVMSVTGLGLAVSYVADTFKQLHQSSATVAPINTETQPKLQQNSRVCMGELVEARNNLRFECLRQYPLNPRYAVNIPTDLRGDYRTDKQYLDKVIHILEDLHIRTNIELIKQLGVSPELATAIDVFTKAERDRVTIILAESVDLNNPYSLGIATYIYPDRNQIKVYFSDEKFTQYLMCYFRDKDINDCINFLRIYMKEFPPPLWFSNPHIALKGYTQSYEFSYSLISERVKRVEKIMEEDQLLLQSYMSSKNKSTIDDSDYQQAKARIATKSPHPLELEETSSEGGPPTPPALAPSISNKDNIWDLYWSFFF